MDGLGVDIERLGLEIAYMVQRNGCNRVIWKNFIRPCCKCALCGSGQLVLCQLQMFIQHCPMLMQARVPPPLPVQMHTVRAMLSRSRSRKMQKQVEVERLDCSGVT